MSKKSYMSLLKEAIAEFDTSDNVEVKGPMLDPILSWDGNGELPVYKDAASILERYYFNEDREERIKTLDEAEYENDNGNPASGPSMKNAKGAGTEQAGTSDAGTVKGGKAEKEKDITKEAEDLDSDETDDESVEEGFTMENSIIEKLIAEMEDDSDDDDDDDDDKDDDDDDDDEDVNESMDPQQHATGAGTEQAGTGDDEDEIPDRKDLHDQMVKPKKYTDENARIEEALAALEAEMEDDAEADEEVDQDLDVDNELAKESSVPGGPSPHHLGEDWEDDEKYYSEAFNIFKEEIDETDDDEDADDDNDDDEVEEEEED